MGSPTAQAIVAAHYRLVKARKAVQVATRACEWAYAAADTAQDAALDGGNKTAMDLADVAADVAAVAVHAAEQSARDAEDDMHAAWIAHSR